MPASVAPEAEREITIVRETDIPARFLFRAWSGPELLMEWYGPPGCPLTLCEVDFRVGGQFRFAMAGPDGITMKPFGGRYLAIEENALLKYTSASEEPGAETMSVTVRFEERAGRTTITMHTLFASVAMMREHTARGYVRGVNAALDQLTELVTGWKDA